MNQKRLKEVAMWIGAVVILFGVLGIPGDYFRSGFLPHNGFADVLTILLGSLAFPFDGPVKATARH